MKSTVLLVKIFTYFRKIDKILGQNADDVNKINANGSNIHKNLNHDNSL